ncbi:hypothetical protein OsI_36978 [Oryza sativa Indica Group]|uniref:Uncharacterized protein n=1 Tax=Oryza sativa subsp. indica TaxID=39946 RepID=B8BIH6_ORYSI|nr:hypothetical protein OsI_36978 [Oryza sativa Indica Group]
MAVVAMASDGGACVLKAGKEETGSGCGVDGGCVWRRCTAREAPASSAERGVEVGSGRVARCSEHLLTSKLGLPCNSSSRGETSSAEICCVRLCIISQVENGNINSFGKDGTIASAEPFGSEENSHGLKARKRPSAYELNEVHQSHVDPLLLATAQDQAHPIYGITANMLAVFHETSDVPGSQLCTLKASFWDELFLVT